MRSVSVFEIEIRNVETSSEDFETLIRQIKIILNIFVFSHAKFDMSKLQYYVLSAIQIMFMECSLSRQMTD